MQEQELKTPPIKVTILEPGPRLGLRERMLINGPLGAGGDPEWLVEVGRAVGRVVSEAANIGFLGVAGLAKEFTVGTVRTGIEFVRTAADLLPGGVSGSIVETVADGANLAIHGTITYKVGYKRILKPLIGIVK